MPITSVQSRPNHVLQNTPMPSIKVPGLEFEMLAAGTSVVKFDLLFELYRTPTGCRGWLEYQTRLFRSSSVRRLIHQYAVLLEAAAGQPDVPNSSLTLASHAAARCAVADFLQSLE